MDTLKAFHSVTALYIQVNREHCRVHLSESKVKANAKEDEDGLLLLLSIRIFVVDIYVYQDEWAASLSL